MISWSTRNAPTCERGAERRFCSEVWRRVGRNREALVRIRDMRLCVCGVGCEAFAEEEEGLELPDWKRRLRIRVRGARGLACTRREMAGRGAWDGVCWRRAAACRCQRASRTGIAPQDRAASGASDRSRCCLLAREKLWSCFYQRILMLFGFSMAGVDSSTQVWERRHSNVVGSVWGDIVPFHPPWPLAFVAYLVVQPLFY